MLPQSVDSCQISLDDRSPDCPSDFTASDDQRSAFCTFERRVEKRDGKDKNRVSSTQISRKWDVAKFQYINVHAFSILAPRQLWIMPSHLWRSRDDVWPRNRLYHWREFLRSARRYSGCLARLIKFSGEYRAYFVYGHLAARYWLRTLLPTKAHFLRCLVRNVVLLCNVSRPDNRAIIIARLAMCIFLGISHDST